MTYQLKRNTDSTSLTLRKERDGKVKISNALSPGYLEKGKDSMEASFANAKDDLFFGILVEAMYKELSTRDLMDDQTHN